MVLVLLGICIFVFLLFALWDLISDGRIREYRYANGEKIPGTVSEKLIVEINGAPNGLFINSKEITNPVLLFVSSGPGTDDYFLNEKYEDMHLEDLFTVVYWDYRGMGIAYDKEIDPDSITSQLIDQDLVAVTEYLKTVFDKEKIYLMGFSGGSKIALEAASAHPELFEAYIGMAQVVTDSCERDTLSYNFMKKCLRKEMTTNQSRSLKGLLHTRVIWLNAMIGFLLSICSIRQVEGQP